MDLGTYVRWTWEELQTMWHYPHLTAKDLAALIPAHSPTSVKAARHRYGRYRMQDVVPLCQKCGQHPVWMAARDAKRLGLCRACAMDEREYRERELRELERRDNVLRQKRFKRSQRLQGQNAVNWRG